MKKSMRKMLSLGAVAIIVALTVISCSKSEEPMPQSSGFLPHYTLLKPVSSPKGTQLYIYKDSTVQREQYKAVIVHPVTLYQTATKNGVTKEQIEAARTELNKNIKDVVSHSITVTDVPGPGVASLDVAITGATVQGAGFSPLNLVPISAAIKLASMATDLDSKTPVMVIELKFTDSVSGKSLLESLAILNGETFRQRANTPEEFEKLAKMWIQKDLEYSLNQR